MTCFTKATSPAPSAKHLLNTKVILLQIKGSAKCVEVYVHIKKWTLTERLHCSHSKAPSGTWSSLLCTVHTACCLLLPQGHSWHGRRCSQLHNKKQGHGHNLEKKTKTLTIEPECHHCLPLNTNMKVPICIFNI